MTTIYNPSTKIPDFNEYQLMLNTGIIPGPRLYHSGNIIMEEVFSRFYATKEVYSEKDAVRVLDNLYKYGINMPIKEYGNPNRKRREWLSKAAIDIGIPITSHDGGTLKVLQNNITRIIDGYSSLEHWVSHGKIYNDVIHFLAKSEINFTPTLMVSPGGLEKLIFNYTDLESLTKLKNIDEEYYKEIIIGLTHYKDRRDYFSEAIDEKMALKLMAQNGVNLSIGGHGNPIPGLSTLGEIWAFTKAGVSNYDALRVATINGAKKLNLQDELGSIEIGKLADLNIFDKCPLLDIRSLNDLGFTIINGQIYDVKSMKLIN